MNRLCDCINAAADRMATALTGWIYRDFRDKPLTFDQ